MVKRLQKLVDQATSYRLNILADSSTTVRENDTVDLSEG